MKNKTVLYIGGFKLPDRNAAAQRVMGIARIAKELGNRVVFYNEIEDAVSQVKKEYFGFECVEDRQSGRFNYLVSAKKVMEVIEYIKPDVLIAYNYPGIALNRIRKYCKENGIVCIADATEWYEPHGNFLHRAIMKVDIWIRMEYVHPRMDGIIAISRYLYDYYKERVKTVIIPPVVDCTEMKWKNKEKETQRQVNFVYAGVPSATKERLDIIINAIDRAAENHSMKLTVVGITEEQYRKIYGDYSKHGQCICYVGRLTHSETLEIVKNSDWAIIIRDNNKVVKAGFPTKVVESITCGTPVIINNFSNVLDYLDDNSCLVTNVKDLEKIVVEACLKKIRPNVEIFDYRYFLDEFIELYCSK